MKQLGLGVVALGAVKLCQVVKNGGSERVILTKFVLSHSYCFGRVRQSVRVLALPEIGDGLFRRLDERGRLPVGRVRALHQA